MSEEKKYSFTIFMEEIDGVHVVHALEAGMLATDDEPERAVFKLSKMLIRHVLFAEKNNRQDEIFHPSPADVWKRFSASQKAGGARVIEERKRWVSPGVILNQNFYATAGELCA